MQTKFTIGIDFGTQSGRAILCDIRDGRIVGTAVHEYAHGVVDSSDAATSLVGRRTEVTVGTALQHPSDYLETLRVTIPKILADASVTPDEVVGIGIDFTSCTILPIKSDGTPLCDLDEFRGDVHAYVKLWKHHGAIAEADYINSHASPEFLANFGGAISCEHLIPKLWEIKKHAPEVYAAADYIVEAGDWVVGRLTGRLIASACMAGYKAWWTKDEGYPSEFVRSLDGLEDFETKLLPEVKAPGEVAGYLTEEAAKTLGLRQGIPVAVSIIDAHSCVPGAGISKPGEMLAIIGTSACYMLLGDTRQAVEGMCGCVDGGILPGFFGYEAGQCCLGDHFEWFVSNCLPKSYFDEAEKLGVSVHTLLCDKAARLDVGAKTPDSPPLIALDWWNGNRSVLCDYTLSGAMVGLTLNTKPEQVYRALIEATAFGARVILDAFRDAGVEVNRLCVTGGIPQKNRLLDQIYADVLGVEVVVAGSPQCGALGAAMLGAAASGEYSSIAEAIDAMAPEFGERFTPNVENSAKYDKLYAEYKRLHDYFGRGENDVMKRLRDL